MYLVKVFALPVHCCTLALFLLAEVVWLSWPVRIQTLASLAHHKVTSLPCSLTLVMCFVFLYLCVGVWLCEPASMWWCVSWGCVEFVQLCWRAGPVCCWSVRVRFACALTFFRFSYCFSRINSWLFADLISSYVWIRSTKSSY